MENPEQILNPEIPADQISLELLDAIAIQALQQGNSMCLDLLYHFQERPDAFGIVNGCLQAPQASIYLKMLALKIFKSCVKTRWELFSIEDRTGLKGFVMQIITSSIGNPALTPILSMSNEIFIEILKYEWPEGYPTLVDELMAIAQSSQPACENVLDIIKMLAEELSEYTDDSLSSSRQAEMLDGLVAGAPQIMGLIVFAFRSGMQDLVEKALRTLCALVKAIDSSLVNDEVLGTLCEVVVPNPAFTIPCLSLFGEISTNTCLNENSIKVIGAVFDKAITELRPLFTDNIYSDERTATDEMVSEFATAMGQMVGHWITLFETEHGECYQLVLSWMLQITQYGSQDDFESCMELWFNLVKGIYISIATRTRFNEAYIPILAILRRLLVSRMEQPSEVMLTVSDSGICTRTSVNSKSTVLYNMMRDTLVYLTNINKSDSMDVFAEKLTEITSSQVFNRNAVSSMCWACGSISHILDDAEERLFLANMIGPLIEICSALVDIRDRAVVASGIMFICAKFSHSLGKYYDILKVVMMKLIAFTCEEIDGVQDAAIDAIKTIVSTCNTQLATKPSPEVPSILEEMLQGIGDIMKPLHHHNISEMYECYAQMINSVSDPAVKAEMMNALLGLINSRLMELAGDIKFSDPDYDSELIFIMNCEEKVISVVVNSHAPQILEILPLLNNMYGAAAMHLRGFVEQGIPFAPEACAMRSVKSSIVRVVKQAVVSNPNTVVVSGEFLNSLFELYMQEYVGCPEGRVPEVVGLFAVLVSRVSSAVQPHLQLIIDHILKPTGEMIHVNFEDFYDFRIELINLMSALVNKCITFMTTVPREDCVFFVECLKFCCSHPEAAISERSISVLFDLLRENERLLPTEFVNEFNSFFTLGLLSLVMELLTDSIHKYAFLTLMGLARKLIGILGRLGQSAQIIELFCTMFDKRSPMEHLQVVDAMVKASDSYVEFKLVLRNFLVSVKKFSPKDPALFAMEREEIEKILEQRKQVPGLVTETNDDAQKMAIELAEFVNKFSLF